MSRRAPRRAPPAAPAATEDEAPTTVDLYSDELALARAQLASGLYGLAEGTLRRRIARIEAGGQRIGDELDGARLLLAEALWRQERPIAARAALDAIRVASPQRRLPIAMVIEAEALAASGEPDRAAGLVERVVGAVGIDEAWRLRAGQPSRLAWPLPTELRPETRRPERVPWIASPAETSSIGERTAAANARLEAARAAYRANQGERGDRELALAVRLDPSLAPAGLALLEPILGERPRTERLLLFGDLLRGAGRGAEASAAYDRALAGRS